MTKKHEIREAIISKLSRYFGISPEEADAGQIYKSTVLSVRDILAQKNKSFTETAKAEKRKRVYYMCMEFLMGRSLKMNLYNLGLEKQYRVIHRWS